MSPRLNMMSDPKNNAVSIHGVTITSFYLQYSYRRYLVGHVCFIAV